MIYKNFYNKYKMSEQINSEKEEKIVKDVDMEEDVPVVLEKEEVGVTYLTTMCCQVASGMSYLHEINIIKTW